MLNTAMMSSDSGDWETPDTILTPLKQWFDVATMMDSPSNGRESST